MISYKHNDLLPTYAKRKESEQVKAEITAKLKKQGFADRHIKAAIEKYNHLL
jgi:hypothetical protein